MGCNQSQDNHQVSHFQQQQYQYQQQQFIQSQQHQQQIKLLWNNEQLSRNNSEINLKNEQIPKPQADKNNQTLEKNNSEYQLLRKQSILKKTQKIIQENLLCSQQMQSNQALTTRRNYNPERQDTQFSEYNRQITQQNIDDDTSEEEYDYNQENQNPNIPQKQIKKNDCEKLNSKNMKSSHQKAPSVYTLQDKINDHLKQFNSGGYGNQQNRQNLNKNTHKKKTTLVQNTVQNANQYNNEQKEEIKVHPQKHIQKVNPTKPKKFISETQNINKVDQERIIQNQQQLEVNQQQQKQQQQRVLNFQNNLHLLTMRKYSSNESSQNTSYQKITQRYNNQLSQNSSYIFNQSNSLLNFRTGKTYEQCRQLYNEIEEAVENRCSVHQFEAYHKFNTLIDKITQKNGEIKVFVITDTSSQFTLSNQQSVQKAQNSTKFMGAGLIQKIQNEIVNFEQFDLIESYLDQNCISYDRRFFAKCVNNVKQLASLITQINFVFNYNTKNVLNQSSSQYRFYNNKGNIATYKVGESFSIEIKVQRPFEEEQLNALSKQHTEYENIYEWYKINQASALGYGFVVNSCFKDEIYTFYIYHDDKNVNLQKALSAFSMYGASMNYQVQQKLETIIPCNDFDIDFHFNEFGLVNIKLNLGKLSSINEKQLLNLYHTQISNCGSVKSFRGIESTFSQINNFLKSNQEQQSFKSSSSKNYSTGTISSTSQSKNTQNSKQSSFSKEMLLSNQQFNILNTLNNSFNSNSHYIIEFNKQGFQLSKSDQIGQDDSALNTQILVCEQFK
ncbi:hypothetical protein ABPG72_013246 [Tetrahymena utriculariae]